MATREGPEAEQNAALALLLPIGTGVFYILPPWVQPWLVFVPQLMGYAGLLIWCRTNRMALTRLGLSPRLLPQGLRWGISVGLVLGLVNVTVILHVVPWLGDDVRFLADTPHARAPVWVMIPWAIVGIAIFVELNFRGFLLGRLLAWGERIAWLRGNRPSVRNGLHLLAIAISAFAFAFDPFMVQTFRHLHWIAVWDGLIWGTLLAVQRNLYTVIAAHAVEVMVMYAIIKLTLEH